MRPLASLVALIAFAAPVPGSTATSDTTPVARAALAAADTPKSEGEVRKVDSAAKKITIKHGELKNLDMPGMTMVFQLNDPAMIGQVKPGDKVLFRADKVNGAFTIMEIEAVK